MIINGNSLDILKTLDDNSIDSCVCDPPYGLSFMGKHWDYDVPQVELWAEVFRVLKPGGHLLAFAGTRTQHRMAVNIEDAGFEIRDMIFWTYASGFPKSLNVFKQFQKQCECGIMEAYGEDRNEWGVPNESQTEYGVRPMSDPNVSQTEPAEKESGQVLQSSVSEQSTHAEGQEALAVLQFSERQEESSVEGRSNLQATKGQLQRSKVRQVSGGVSANGEERRLHNGTQTDNGAAHRQAVGENGSSTSRRPQSEQQFDREPCAFCKQWYSQAIRAYGFGTALKPACEPITIARKPLEGTVSQNVLKWGTGGINIDGSRVGTDTITQTRTQMKSWRQFEGRTDIPESADNSQTTTLGRFPANLIHDGSDEVVGLFPETKSGWKNTDTQKSQSMFMGEMNYTGQHYADNQGSAARFFYCAKSSRQERNRGLEGFEEKTKPLMGEFANNPGRETAKSSPTARANHHPTVKPIKLMQYLVKLVTPKGGTVLDPFNGSGTTGIACKLEGFDYIGIELDPEYCKISEARIEAWQPEQLQESLL